MIIADARQPQGGETYNKARAYGQAKTANMLMALSLAEKLGKKGLQAYSLHPGVIHTNLANHLDWNVDFEALRTLAP
jgi:NAD(P)-dependent dehydrogenase (short-subunit alcohol dehydrogenase family)